MGVGDSEPDDRLGIAELVKQRAKEVYLSHEALEKNVKRLEEEIEGYEKPVIVTEGKFDAQIIKTAWKKLNPEKDMPFDVTSCSAGATEEDEQAGAHQLQTYLDSILFSEDKVRIGIFDNDKAGLDSFQRLKRFAKKNGSAKTHNNGKAHAMLLPTPQDNLDEYWPTSGICIEFLFKKEYLTDAYVQRVYNGADGKEASEQQAKILDEELDENQREKLGSLFKLDYRVRNNRKKHFAEKKVPEFNPEAFTLFGELFDNINILLTSE